MGYHKGAKCTEKFRLHFCTLLLFITLLAACTAQAGDVAEVTAAQSEGDEAASQTTERLVLATTTSTDDAGLLDAILPNFESQCDCAVDVVAVGTGQALALGEAGDADVLLVHARAREEAFVESGNGTQRYDVMSNDFVIVGSENDLAAIRGLENAAEAFMQIAEAQAAFISRGDDSGTHSKERTLWQNAGIDPQGDWYQEAGQGMGAVLTIANEQAAYTLTDRGTFIARNAAGLDLIILVEGDAALANPYGVVPVSPQQHPDVNFDLAQQFVDWLTSIETQQMIADYTVNGQPLFFPDSTAWRIAQERE